MNIILVSGPSGKSRMLSVGTPLQVLMLTVLLLAFGAALAYGGYRYGHDRQVAQVAPDPHSEITAQQRAISEARREIGAEVDALTRRLGQLQGHITRVDALGQKLVSMADLDEGEFDFSAAPPVGGPETRDAYAALRVPELEQAMDALVDRVVERERQLEVLEQFILSKNLEREVSPSGRPIRSGWLSSPYGKRTSPFTGAQQFHKGVDFAGKLGSDVIAVAGGVVAYSGQQPGYGYLLEINHGNGYSTRYGHNMENLVDVGEAVKKGQVIARMGSTGRSTGPHVHFEVIKDGRHINPHKFIAQR